MIRKFLQNIFKKFFYSFFKIIYGRIKQSVKVGKDDRTKLQISSIEKNINYKVYLIKNSRLYTDRVHDTAIIIDNKIIEGPSIQIRKNQANSKISDNIVFEKGTPRIKKKLKGSALSLLTGGGGNNNYWHWLYDVLPRLKICEKIKELKSINYFLLPSLKNNFQKDTLRILGIKKEKLLSSEKYRHIEADEIIVTDHPYVFTDNPHSDTQKIPNWIIMWLKEKFLKNLNKSQLNSPKKIYIDRSDSKSNIAHLRTITNEKEVREFLKEKGFKSVQLGNLSFSEQVRFFNNAEYIVGLHGSGFANLPFCEPDTKIIEFRNSTTGEMYANIAKKNNLNYSSIIVDNQDTNLGIQHGHIHVPTKKLAELLN